MKIKEVFKRLTKVTVICGLMVIVLLAFILLIIVTGMLEGILYILPFIAIFALCGAVSFITNNKDLFSKNNDAAPEKKDWPIIYGEESVDDISFEKAYSYDDVGVAGSEYHDLSGIEPGMRVRLLSEPENEHDEKAVALYVGNNKIGYLPKNRLQEMYHDFKWKGGVVTAVVSGAAEKSVTISLNYYKKADVVAKLNERGATKTYRLTGNTNAEMQENIQCSSVGEIVLLEYDEEKDKYSAYASGYIGFFPKSASKYLEGNTDAYISDIGVGDNDKYYVEVIIGCE